MRLALHTVLYPEALRYFDAWCASVEAQEDTAFDVAITLDGLTPEAVRPLLSPSLAQRAQLLEARAGDGLAQVREASWRALAPRYDALVMADSDDVLHPGRIASARRGLADAELSVCALRLVDQGGAPLGVEMWPGALGDPKDYIYRCNDIGLSHVSYRTELLMQLMPLPTTVRLVDWLLAQRAVARGARVAFEGEIGMDYRQHSANMAGLQETTAARVRRSASMVEEHHRLLRDDPMVAAAREAIVAMGARLQSFREKVIGGDEGALERYVVAYNALSAPLVWWSEVAHPELEAEWTRSSSMIAS